MAINASYKIILLTFFVAHYSLGCGLIENRAKKEQRIQEVLTKKDNYNNLRQQLISKRLQKGTSQEEIKAEFGKPDNVFRSGSSVSTMEIWAYERILDKADNGAWETIRLYFESDKLITWQF